MSREYGIKAHGIVTSLSFKCHKIAFSFHIDERLGLTPALLSFMMAPRLNESTLHRWLIPLLSVAALFAFLLLFFPYNSGDSSINSPLGRALWTIWTASGPQAPDTPVAPDYSYCLLVPFMVSYCIYKTRSRIAQAPIQGKTAAILWIILGLALFWVGSRAGKQYVGCAGIQLLVLGVIYWFWGGSVFRHLLFVWAILCFAWPLPFLDSAVAFPLRMIVSHLSYYTLNLIGIPCIQDGTALISAPIPHLNMKMGDRFQIDIADPCSGLHSLLPLLMFSSFYSYFFLRNRWHQWIVFLSAIPFTIAGNVVRILMLVTGSITWGSAFAIGTNDNPSWFHEACGFAVFVIVLGMECLLGFRLIASERHRLKRSDVNPTRSSDLTDSSTRPSLAPLSGSVALWRSGIMVGLTVIMMAICWITPTVYLPSTAGIAMDLPREVTLPDLTGGHFFGVIAPVSDIEHQLLPKDTEFSRKNYDDLHDHQVFFSVVLSGVQQYAVHPIEVCLNGQGWSITKQEDYPIPIGSAQTLTVRNLSLQRDAIDGQQKHVLVKAYYMYWYVADGLTTPSRQTRNWITSWDRVVHNRDHRWAFVAAMSLVTQSFNPDGLDADQTRTMLKNFIRQILPTIQNNESLSVTEKPDHI